MTSGTPRSSSAGTPATDEPNEWQAIALHGSRPALTGRDGELAQLTDLWGQVRDDGRGRCCVLRAAVGGDANRLTEEVLEIARRGGSPALNVACGLDDPGPHAPLRQALENLLHQAEAMPAQERADLHLRIRAAAGISASLLAGLSPALATVLDTGRLLGGERQEQFAAAVARFIIELARLSGGMVMVAQDADLIDSRTRRVLSHIAAELADVPMLSIATVRREPHPIPGEPAPEEPAPEEPAAGQPSLSVALYATPDLDLDLAPLAEAATGQLKLNDHHSRRLFVAAAVCGSRFRPDVVAEVYGIDFDVVQAAMADAASRRLIEPAGGGEFHFSQERVRAAVLDGVGADELARLHQGIAETLDRRQLGTSALTGRPNDDLIYPIAWHYLHGIPSRSTDRAVELCRTAGEQALAAHAPGSATAFLEHATMLRPGDSGLLTTLATALQRDGRQQLAREYFEQALSVEQDELRRARILVILTELNRATGDTREAVRTVERGLAELDAALPRSRVLRVISALGLGLTALVIMITGLGFAAARDRDRQRQQVLARLHLAGADLAESQLRPGDVLIHRLRAALAAAHLRAGHEYSLSCAGLGLTAAGFGLRRLSRRQLARAAWAAAESADPQLVAEVAWASAAAEYRTGDYGGERWIRCLTKYGYWLDGRRYNAGIMAICWDAALQGRISDVDGWYRRCRRHAAGLGFAGPPSTTETLPTEPDSTEPDSAEPDGAEPDSTETDTDSSEADITEPTEPEAGIVETDTTEANGLLGVQALRLAATGQPAEALTELSLLRTALGPDCGLGPQLDLVLAEMYALAEQGELGEHFEVTAARFFSFGLPTSGLIRRHRSFLVLHTRGRLAQCRAAQSTPAVTVLLKIARQAVRRLGAAADTPALRAAHRQCQAELYLLQGHPERALRALKARARIKHQPEYAPLSDFEVHRTTARALLATDSPKGSHRHVLAAITLAENRSWSQRLRSLKLEFGV